MATEQRKGLMVRLPATLHAELVGKAEEQGVSLNSLMIALLAGSMKFNLKPKPEANTDNGARRTNRRRRQ